MVTMKDVAKQAGVSVATVSNVINGKNFVSPSVKTRVELAIQDLGYRVNLLARGLKIRQTNTIGVVLPDISKVFFPHVLKGIQDAARDAGYRVNFLSSDYNLRTERECVEYLLANCVDGIILDSASPPDELEKWGCEVASAGSDGHFFPVVSMEQPMAPRFVSTVLVDLVDASRRETLHLIDSGRTDIVYVRAKRNLWHVWQRCKGYRQALKERGIPYRPELVLDADFDEESSRIAVKKFIESGVSFDAVQCMNDSIALGAMKALAEAGFSVPEDVAVAGWDNVYLSSLVTPQITTVEYPQYELGSTAFAELRRLMDDPEAHPRSILLNAELLVRGSSVAGHSGDWKLSV